MPANNVCCVNVHSSHSHPQLHRHTLHLLVIPLLKLITFPTAPTYTAPLPYHIPTIMMSLKHARSTYPLSIFDASVPILSHSPTTSDTRLWKRQLSCWSMGA